MLNREGVHTGSAQYVRAKSAPLAARLSKAGVFAYGLPAQLGEPACIWSEIMSKTFSWAGVKFSAANTADAVKQATITVEISKCDLNVLIKTADPADFKTGIRRHPLPVRWGFMFSPSILIRSCSWQALSTERESWGDVTLLM
jgi:hypothetical protein